MGGRIHLASLSRFLRPGVPQLPGSTMDGHLSLGDPCLDFLAIGLEYGFPIKSLPILISIGIRHWCSSLYESRDSLARVLVLQFIGGDRKRRTPSDVCASSQIAGTERIRCLCSSRAERKYSEKGKPVLTFQSGREIRSGHP